jgi:hypothetical protein
VDHAQQRTGRKVTADLEPWVKLLPSPVVHADLAALAALATPNEDRPARSIKVGFLKSDGFADPQPGAPQQHDQRTEAMALAALADRAHDRHDLLDGWWVSRILLSLVARRAASVIAGHGRGRAAMASGVQQHGFHESSVGWGLYVCC